MLLRVLNHVNILPIVLIYVHFKEPLFFQLCDKQSLIFRRALFVVTQCTLRHATRECRIVVPKDRKRHLHLATSIT